MKPIKLLLGLIPDQEHLAALADFQLAHVPAELRPKSEPHITIKAPDCLGQDWNMLPGLRDLLSANPPFLVRLLDTGTFVEDKRTGKDFLYARVYSPELIILHQTVFTMLGDTVQQSKNKHEGFFYTPHITLAAGSRLVDNREQYLRIRQAAEEMLSTLPLLRIRYAYLFRQQEAGGYVPCYPLAIGSIWSYENHENGAGARMRHVETLALLSNENPFGDHIAEELALISHMEHLPSCNWIRKKSVCNCGVDEATKFIL